MVETKTYRNVFCLNTVGISHWDGQITVTTVLTTVTTLKKFFCDKSRVT